ncbi:MULTISPECIES: hypothetical protein [Sulfurimonas]|uniref:hypothetical protein n=1 Tax=Sulfurimonas TaxID=202746 RepID=UPI001264F866|nr:hypothetical protein [Sulfurimonas indica]
MKKILALSLFASAILMAESEIDAIKAELQAQKETTQKLEEKLDALSRQQESTSVNRSASFSQNAYLPDIAFILNMSAVGRDVANGDYENFAIPGFIDASGATMPFNKERGFNLNYAEVALHSVVDPYFEAVVYFHLQPNEFEIGEAYVQTTSLPYYLRVKAGKFKSSFGRINSKHHHSWYFDAQPIIYKALFGPDGISDPGVQLQWIAPTDAYLMFGAEALQGTNARSFGDNESNNLYVGYVKSSLDVTDELSILGGISYAHGKNTTTNATDVYGLDLTLRQELGSYSFLLWQSEYLHREKELATRSDTQAGLYSELIYQYDKNYAAGFRYDAITKNEADLTSYNGVDTSGLDKYSVMVEYKPFPMSRLRFSYSYDRTKVINDERRNINEVMLSLNIAAGAHSAHDY